MPTRAFMGLLVLLVSSLAAQWAAAADTQNPAFWKHHLSGNYDQVLEALKHGLETHQFTITGEQDLSGALERNKEVLGEKQWNTIGFGRVTAVHFCSLLFNQQAFNTDLDLAILCPFKLVAYNKKAAPEEITVITLRPGYLVREGVGAGAKALGEQMELRIIDAIKSGLEPF